MPAATDTETALAPGKMTVIASTCYDLEADGADIQVEIRGSAIFHSNVAFKKAKEVAQLVSDLRAAGVSENDIRLDGVRAEQTSGRSSSATYNLTVRCTRVESVPDVLTAITAQPNATMRSIAWRYPEEHAANSAAVETCIRRIQSKANLLTRGLGLRILGVASVRESLSGSEPHQTLASPAMIGRARAGGAAPSVDLGVDVSHIKCVTQTVNVEYYVASVDTEAA